MNNAILHPVIMLAAAAIGLLLGSLFDLSDSTQLIEPLLIVMLFFVFLCIDYKEIGRSFANMRFTATAVIINFVWTPIFAILLGLLFSEIDIRVGLLMLLVTPCTDWYLVFTSIAKGNIPLSSALLPVNLILQIVLLPIYLILFFDTELHIDIPSMLFDMSLVILIPLISAIVVRVLSGRIRQLGKMTDAVMLKGDSLQLLFLCLAITTMFASESEELMDNLDLAVLLIAPLLLFFVVNYYISAWTAKIQRFDFRDQTSLIFTTMARNSPLSLAIAVAAFPDATLTLMVLVIAPLIELPVLSLTAGHRLRLFKKAIQNTIGGRVPRQ